VFQNGGEQVKIAMYVVGAMLMLAGIVWFLQGINILPGSFMTGDIRWAFYGGIAFFIGLGLILWASRRR
jgi:hypothetical protein